VDRDAERLDPAYEFPTRYPCELIQLSSGKSVVNVLDLGRWWPAKTELLRDHDLNARLDFRHLSTVHLIAKRQHSASRIADHGLSEVMAKGFTS
jgi:hypothetical protein